VAVIGGGVVGASAAYHLASAGAEVVVVDRADAGQATAAGAGVVFPWPLPGEPPAWAAVCAAAEAHWPQLAAALAADGVDDCGYRRAGGISVTRDPSAVGAMVQGTTQMRASGLGLGDIRPLGEGEPRRLFGVLDGALAGVYVANIGTVDGRRLRDALLRGATSHGATVRSGVARCTIEGDERIAVGVEGEPLAAEVIVAAGGAWTTELCGAIGVELPTLYPLRGQLLHLDVPGADTTGWPVVQTASGYYLLAFPGGRVVVGSTREEVGFDHRVTVSALRELLPPMLEVAPDLAEATLVEVRVGFRPSTRDNLPLLGPVPDRPGLVVATGLGANGLTAGPAVGAIAADLALDRTPRFDIDLGPYRPDRPVP
jgi:D-amino-acid dehydrogenase